MILAISSPSRSTNDNVAPSGIDPDLPTPVRHGIALTQLIETYPAEKLPKTGGCSATVVVTMTLEQLIADLDHAGVCTLDTGAAHRERGPRLACTAGIIPVVLGGRARPSTSAADADSTTNRCGSRWVCATAAAPPKAAKHLPASATPTTTPPGPTADPPASKTAASSAPTTTTASTTPATRRSTYPAEKSASIAARRPALRGERWVLAVGCDSRAAKRRTRRGR